MFEIMGTLYSTFVQPGGKNSDGTTRPDQPCVSLLVAEPLRNGELRHDMKTLKVDSLETFAPYEGKEIRLRVGLFARGNELVVFGLKGSRPSLVDPNGVRSAGA